MVRDILAQRTAAAAIGAATNPARASSYNNLIAHADGTIVNVEGKRSRYFCFVARHPDHVTLSFEYGVLLANDAGLLEGSGSQVRYATIRRAEDIREQELAAGTRVLSPSVTVQGRNRLSSAAGPYEVSRTGTPSSLRSRSRSAAESATVSSSGRQRARLLVSCSW